jgi:PEGA domain-containing protein
MKARQTTSWLSILFAFVLILFTLIDVPVVHAQNAVMGEIHFEGKTKVEKTSGVWVDGQYVGYLKELKGAKKVLLLPGEHVISVRQNGYQDFTQRVTLRPGQKQLVFVAMMKAPTGAFPALWSTVKLSVSPSRAAVFLDGRFVGHVGEFEGVGRALQVAPGDHKIKIALPGFKSFETEINPTANQKVEVKTELVKSNTGIDDPALKGIEEAPPQP